jgi:hypothetical protein
MTSVTGAYQIAVAHPGRGEVEMAFAWCERGSLQRDPGQALIKVDPTLRSLHVDPR